MAGQLLKNSLNFDLSEGLYFSFTFAGYFCWICRWFDSLSFQCFNIVIPLFIGFQYFWWRVSHIYVFLPLYVINCFSVAVPEIFLILVFNSMIMICPGIVFFSIFFPLCSCSLGLHLMCVSMHNIILQVTKALFFWFFFLYWH